MQPSPTGISDYSKTSVSKVHTHVSTVHMHTSTGHTHINIVHLTHTSALLLARILGECYFMGNYIHFYNVILLLRTYNNE